MKYKKLITKIIVILIGIITTLFVKNPVYLIGVLIYLVASILSNKFSIYKKEKINKAKELDDFHNYLKRVILLTYTRPLKRALIDANKTKNQILKEKIDQFINQLKYDFTVEPFKNLALIINKERKDINYELNIMYLLYEYDKKALGREFINDILDEIDNLIDNQLDQKVEDLKESAYIYTLPPTVINFFYITMVLFEVIDQMIMSVLN